MSADGGQIVPPQFLRELSALLKPSPAEEARIKAWHERARAREAARWAALTPYQRARERFQRSVVVPLGEKKRSLGMRIAGITEADLERDW